MENGNFEGYAVVLMDGEKITGLQDVFKNCFISCEVKTEQRKFSDDMGQSMSNITLSIDLTKMKYPWQPHTDQPWSIAETFLKALMDEYQDYCENADCEEGDEENE